MEHRALIFTVHKAASLGVYDVMRRIARKEGWPLHSANIRTPNLQEPEKPGDENFYHQLGGKTGLVGPVRYPVLIPDDARASDRFILHLRDPRDVLVSMFFSYVYSHPGVDEEWRQRQIERGVDEFVRSESKSLIKRYDLYANEYLSLPNLTFLRYEEFIADRPSWLEKLLNGLGVKDGLKRYRRLANDNPAAKVKREDKTRHIRKATPGDFREKLSPETIARLNSDWSDILKTLGYED
ncbi:sulfotransferase domain-containing protein [Hyphococcus lacteus]|uniref:Sulfotransferase domain-containing protein n=1 Tax=Hyphococcus lacteus TaxID=3143536 RepID=A0ABV3Z4L7_9PROT